MRKILLTILIFVYYLSSNAQSPLRINKYLVDSLTGSGYWYLFKDTTHTGQWGRVGGAGGGGASENWANTDLTFTGDREHHIDNHFVEIDFTSSKDSYIWWNGSGNTRYIQEHASSGNGTYAVDRTFSASNTSASFLTGTTFGSGGNQYFSANSTATNQTAQIGSFHNISSRWIDILYEVNASSTTVANSHVFQHLEQNTGSATQRFTNSRWYMDSTGFKMQTLRKAGAVDATQYKGIVIDTSSNIVFENYPSSRNDGGFPQKATYFDANGKVQFGYLDTTFYQTKAATKKTSDSLAALITGGGGTPASPSGSVQYNNAGSFGGSANLTYNGSLQTNLSTALGTTPDDTKGIVLINTTAASVGAQQISPAIRWSGQGWSTGGGGSSLETEFRAYILPTQATGNPISIWKLESSVNGGSYSSRFQVRSDGSIILNTGIIEDGSQRSMAMAGSSVYGGINNAVILSTNAIDSSSNTFMGGGQNSVIQQNSTGAVSLGTDGRIHAGAPYSLILNDANEVKADASTVGGFSVISAVTNGFAYGNDVDLGSATGNLNTTAADAYTDSHAMGVGITTTGDRNMTFGMRINNFGQESIIIGGGITGSSTRLVNNRAGIIGFGKNSDSLTVIIKSAAGTTGTYGETEMRGAFRLTNNTYNSGSEIVALGIDTLTGLVYRKTATGGGGSPGGSDREIQINNSGSFGTATWKINSSSEMSNISDQGAYKFQIDGDIFQQSATSDGSTTALRITAASGGARFFVWSDGHIRMGTSTNTGTGIIEIDDQRPIVVYNSSAGGYSLLGVQNDQHSTARAFEMAYTGSSYSGAYLTNGVTGESANLYTSGNYPLMLGTNNTARINISNGGTVTIIDLAGTGSRNVVADANGLLSAPVSDFSVKRNIQPIDYGLNTIMQLNPVSFYYKDGWTNYGANRQIGFIAQDIAKVLPNSAFTTPSTGKMGYNEIDLVPVLVKAMQEQQQQIEGLKNEINKLKNR